VGEGEGLAVVLGIRSLPFRSLPAADATRATLLDVYFDDRSWLVRYFVLDPGDPLPRREVLVLAQDVSCERGGLHVRLTHDELRRRPEVDEDPPFFLQHGMGLLYRGGNPHLRSCEVTLGFAVMADDGRAGHVRDLALEGPPWRVSGLLLDTGLWFPGRTVRIAPAHVSAIDYIERVVRVRLARGQLQRDPDLAAA
jgi:hypothetical protein